MSHVRVYLPISPEDAQRLHRERSLELDHPGFAVTDAVRTSHPGGDQELWEYAALQDAAQHCLDTGAPVLVAAADIDPHQVHDSELEGSRVTVAGTLTLPRVAALHVGDEALGAETSHDPDAEVELSWYDTTELGHLVSLVGEPPDPKE
ncbi:DUF6912 family protein [Ornithinicoccus halotolerans]|uniref:DUF6912 family protein n=1 Tax=Ornithinicoccus halotolerans TaxID=1748220 RepID=UPI00129570C2|nr:hypothetical protein [Ornithinicoccus halotolerans]